jgi:hypothetical protein
VRSGSGKCERDEAREQECDREVALPALAFRQDGAQKRDAGIADGLLPAAAQEQPVRQE